MKFRLTGAGRKTILSQFLKLNFSIPTIEECAMTTYVFQKVKWPFFHMHTMYVYTDTAVALTLHYGRYIYQRYQ